MRSSIHQFKHFIEEDMRMSHIYQPLLIRMLLEKVAARPRFGTWRCGL